MSECTLDERAQLRRTVVQARRLTGLPVVFGGSVSKAGVVLSESSGMRTGSLRNLLVAPQRGLGGHAIQARRPVAVLHYGSSPAISHDYDRQVAAEGLVSLVAIPVAVGRQIRAVLYGALRRPGPIGDVAVDRLAGAATQLGAILRAQERRASPARGELAAVFGELGSLAGQVGDARLRAGILASCDRYAMLRSQSDSRAPAPRLTTRELDVLALAAIGCGNHEIAGLLDITVDSVKSHVRRAMRRLGANTRHAAVSAARANGLLP